MQGYIYEKYKIWRQTYFILGFIGCIIIILILLTMYYNRKSIINDKKLNIRNEDEKLLVDSNGNNNKNKLTLTVTNYLNWCLGLYGFAQFTIFSSIFGLWMIPYLMLKFNYKRSKASFCAGIGTASVGIGTLLFGYLGSKYKKRKIYLIISDKL